jgi:hypothetical protein
LVEKKAGTPGQGKSPTRAWSLSEIQRLKDLLATDDDPGDVAVALGRHSAEVRKMIRQIKAAAKLRNSIREIPASAGEGMEAD